MMLKVWRVGKSALRLTPRNWSVPKINFMFVIHKHLFVICVCVTQICSPKTNFVFVNHKGIVNL
jgi:hypothetical protein